MLFDEWDEKFFIDFNIILNGWRVDMKNGLIVMKCFLCKVLSRVVKVCLCKGMKYK